MSQTQNDETTDAVSLPPEVIEVVTNSIIEGARGHVRGLSIGERAPDFALRDRSGALWRLADHLERGPVLVAFVRGEWCPFCRGEMHMLESISSDVRARGASMVVIHPRLLERMREVEASLGYDVLADELMNVMAGFRVKFPVTRDLERLYRDVFDLDLGRTNATAQWNLPVPAMFVVDTDGIIKARHFSHDFAVRADPDYLLGALERLPLASPELVVEGDRSVAPR